MNILEEVGKIFGFQLNLLEWQSPKKLGSSIARAPCVWCTIHRVPGTVQGIGIFMTSLHYSGQKRNHLTTM